MQTRLTGSRYHVLLRSLVLLFAVIAVPDASADWFKRTLDVMGTRVQVELWQQDEVKAQACIDKVFAEMHRIDALMSPYKPDSEVSLINAGAGSKAIAVSEEVYDLLQRSVAISAMSGGAFDITFSSVGYYYDYRQKLQPDEELIRQKLDAINYKNLQLKDRTVHFARAGMRIDLGGIAKGHAVDNAIEILKQCDVQQALVSAGGDSRILGDRQGRPWMIGIRHPRDSAAVALSMPLTDSAMSTSGDYERFFIAGDERIHHIINPKTGRSADRSWSATVIGPRATVTDALSTTLFVLGADRGLELIETLDGIDAIIIDASGVVHYSSGLMDPAEKN